MKTISRTILTTLSAGFFAALLVSPATAGCGDLISLQGPFLYAQQRAHASQGDANGNPQTPDGVVVDFGYVQLHSDGTELMNSGGHAPATENFCMGVWGQTGFLAFEVNHFALSHDATTGMLNGKVNIREQLTLSPSGDSYAGTFTINIYDQHRSSGSAHRRKRKRNSRHCGYDTPLTA